MKFHLPRRVISLFLAFVLAASLVVPAAADDSITTYATTPTSIKVSLDQPSLELILGNNTTAIKTLTATVTVDPVDDSYTDYDIEWESSDPSKVTVGNAGDTSSVTGVAEGEAIVTVTVKDKTDSTVFDTAECKVTVKLLQRRPSLRLRSPCRPTNYA